MAFLLKNGMSNMIMSTETGTAVIDLANGIWRSHKSNKTIDIIQMPDEYLQFTIAMLKRGYDVQGERISNDLDCYIPALEAEAVRRGLQPKEDGWDA